MNIITVSELKVALNKFNDSAIVIVDVQSSYKSYPEAHQQIWAVRKWEDGRVHLSITLPPSLTLEKVRERGQPR